MGELAIPPAETGGAIATVPTPYNDETIVGATMRAQVEATIKARYGIAQMRQRDLDTVRQKMLANGRRPSFAEMATYKKPIGGGKFVEGESIRFAEAAAMAMGNLITETIAVEETDKHRVYRVVTTDIETNTSFSTDIMVAKTVERRFAKEGQTIISSRRNSNGDIVHTVEASEDDMLTKSGNAISKAMRNNILRLIPGDIIDDCLAECRATLASGNKQDPDAARKKLLDAFGFFGVLPNHIAEYLGHEASQLSSAELDDLRKQYTAVKTGESSWPAIMQAKAEELGKKAAAENPSAAKTAADKVREKTEQK
jgi:hypothetical protein